MSPASWTLWASRLRRRGEFESGENDAADDDGGDDHDGGGMVMIMIMMVVVVRYNLAGWTQLLKCASPIFHPQHQVLLSLVC